MSYNNSGSYDEITLKQHVPFYFSRLAVWQVIFCSLLVLIFNILSLIILLVFTIMPSVLITDGHSTWFALLFLLAPLAFVYPALTVFIATRPELDRNDVRDYKINDYLNLPKDIRKKLKPLAKHVNYNRDGDKWCKIINEYTKLELSGHLESTHKAVYDSVLEDIAARKETLKIMKEQGWT